MNSTTSFDFTSWSMNCSMLIFASFCGTTFRPASALNPTLSYMYPKPLCIQSKLGGSWYAPHRLSEGRTTPRNPHPGLDHGPGRLLSRTEAPIYDRLFAGHRAATVTFSPR